MKKLILLIAATLLLVLPVMLSARINYLSEQEYKDLSSDERTRYNERLTTEMADLQVRRADAIAQKADYQTRISALSTELEMVQANYDEVYGRVLAFLGVSTSDLPGIRQKLDGYNRMLTGWERMSDDDLWAAKKEIRNLRDDFEAYAGTKYAKVPDFVDEISDLRRRFEGLENSLQNARPKYYEEDYTVKRGDYLAKISGYSFIYGDASKWGVIYRANRDQIKDPNIINPDQVLRIPRGLPYQWKVWKGESLWKIASYPEVYGNGSEWPVIYRANQDQIKDPNVIHPKQMLELPRN